MQICNNDLRVLMKHANRARHIDTVACGHSVVLGRLDSVVTLSAIIVAPALAVCIWQLRRASRPSGVVR